MPLLKAETEDPSHKFLGVLRIKHYIGKEASNMVSRFDQPGENFRVWTKDLGKWMKNYFMDEDFNSEDLDSQILYLEVDSLQG